MNYGIIIRVSGSLLLIESAAMLLPLLISLYYKQNDALSFFITILVTGILGALMVKLPRKNNTIKIREGLVIVTIGWFIMCLFGSLPFLISGSVKSFPDAFFEVVSGFTTTGATVIDNIEAIPKGILFWRSLTHWMGGMGILVFTIAIVPALGIGSFQIFKAESPGPAIGRFVPKIKDMAKILYGIYLIITVVEIILLSFSEMSLFEAVVYSFGTVGTGGFSTRGGSVGAYNSTYVNIVIGVFMVLSGINFNLYYLIYKRKFKDIIRDQELRFYLGIVTASTILISIDLYRNFYKDIGKSVMQSFFQVSSIITTTGYATYDFDKWSTFSKAILFLLMFVGGCAGSTTGSVKSIRILVLLKNIKREITKIFHPKAVVPIKVNQKSLPQDTVNGITAFFILYMLVFAIGTLLISLEGINLISAASAVAATLGNIGIGFDFVGPVHTFSRFSAQSKLLFSFLMIMGRLELFTVIALFSRKFWKDEI